VIWVLVETITIMIVLIVSQSGTPRGVEAAAKYFVTQAVARRFLLVGILRRFFVSGGFDLFGSYDMISYFFFMLGVFIKMAVLPNPFWLVDVVRGVSLSRAFFVIIGSKIIPVYLFICLSGRRFLGGLSVLGLFSVFLGSVLGINQISIRKILAFSSVAHMGWMVSCFACLSGWYCAVLFLCYALSLLPIFFISSVCSMEGIFKRKSAQFFSRLAGVVVVSLLSLGGLPPLVGFFYKWLMFLGLVDNGLFLVAGLLVLLRLVSLYYYLRVTYSIFRIY